MSDHKIGNNGRDFIAETTVINTNTSNRSVAENRSQSMDAGKCKRPQLFHSVSIIVEPVLDDEHSSKPLILTPTSDIKSSEASPQSPSPILDYDDFIFGK